MPITGTLDLSPRVADAPLMPNLDTEPWELPRVEMLYATFEIDDSDIAALVPKALHPNVPPTVTLLTMRVPESPVGPFMLAQVRVGCRAGTFQRGLLTRAYCDSDAAIKELGERWGFDAHSGMVELDRGYDRIVGRVEADGELILEYSGVDPLPISGSDLRYVDNLNLARVERDGKEVPRLIQVDPTYVFHTADRATPEIAVFDPDAWAAETVDPVYPVSASFTVADVTLPKLRYIIDPDTSALSGGTERL